MRNGFQGFCLLMKLLRKAHIKILERLLMLSIKILAAVNDGNIGESYVLSAIYAFEISDFKNEIVSNLMYFYTIKFCVFL